MDTMGWKEQPFKEVSEQCACSVPLGRPESQCSARASQLCLLRDDGGLHARHESSGSGSRPDWAEWAWLPSKALRQVEVADLVLLC